MTYINLIDIKTELINYMRNQDIISTSDRGVTTTTEEFDGDTIETQFTLTTLATAGLKNVRSVTVDTVTQTYGEDYTVDFANKRINFTVAPGTGTNNVDIEYDYGTTDKIFDDYPPTRIKLSQFPRIAVDVISGQSDFNGIGEEAVRTTYQISVTCYSDNKRELEGMIALARSKLNAAHTSLYYLSYIRVLTMGPLIPSPFGSDSEQRIFQRNQDFEGFVVNEE